MRVDWVPFSASALVAGATALSVGALLRPQRENGNVLGMVESDDGRWLGVAALYFLASVMLTVGLPAVLTLFEKKGYRTCLAALAAFAMGTVGIAGFAMMLAFFEALLDDEANFSPATVDQVLQEPGLAVLLYAWVLAFYVGELLLAVALLRARIVQRWIPVALLVHVALFPLALADVMPQQLRTGSALLVTVGLAGVGIAANSRHARRR